MMQLVLGGARSGKSRLAESIAKNSGKPVTYIATAEAGDEEMSQRIRHHQSTRPDDWQLVEAPLLLVDAIEAATKKTDDCILVDCLTLWLSNWLCRDNEKQFANEKQRFLELIKSIEQPLILVSNEVGSGIVPMGKISRRFVDESGWLNQRLAQDAAKAFLVVAGCAIPLSPDGILPGEKYAD